MSIHWCGAGMSSGPGLRRLIKAGHPVIVWNKSLEEAHAAVGDITQSISEFDFDLLSQTVNEGDIIVSMLPTDWHVRLADMCINKAAHFISASYISPEMQALHAKALLRGVACVNEVGLDPGIDHIMAHHLVAAYRASDAFDPKNDISFHSYCGGIPKDPNAFRYKFSWSPLGVLQALLAPSRSIRHFTELNITHPWDAITSYDAPLRVPESFEVYPNRDSFPYMDEYGFEPSWRVKEFARGTLRLNGWAEAWSDIFAALEEGPDKERLKELAEELWQENTYSENEKDRVVLCVELKAERDGRITWHRTFALDAFGDERGTAMARLVSMPVSITVEAIMHHEIPAGVSAAPSDPKLTLRFLNAVDKQAQFLQLVNHV